MDRDASAKAIAALIGRQAKQGNKVMVIGNGGSATIAAHTVLDLINACHIRAMSFSDPGMLTCFANDYGYEQVYAHAVALFADADDVLVAISSSGQSPNILRAVEEAKRKGCYIVTISGFGADNPLSKSGDINYHVPSRDYNVVEPTHAVFCHKMTEEISHLTE